MLTYRFIFRIQAMFRLVEVYGLQRLRKRQVVVPLPSRLLLHLEQTRETNIAFTELAELWDRSLPKHRTENFSVMTLRNLEGQHNQAGQETV